MTSQFMNDLSQLKAELSSARNELMKVLASTSNEQLHIARRGGWSVRRVLEHVITSEESYARMIAHLNGRPIAEPTPDGVHSSVDDAAAKLSSSRATLLRALDGVDEDAFYALRQLANEEYSIVSVLENVISHDHEHSTQLVTTLQQAQPR